jgi:hypothetical protein
MSAGKPYEGPTSTFSVLETPSKGNFGAAFRVGPLVALVFRALGKKKLRPKIGSKGAPL